MTGTPSRIDGPHLLRRCAPACAALTAIILGLVTSARAETPADLATKIDRLLAERFREEQIPPAPTTDDAEFLRRLHLDLIGRPPEPQTVREFLQDTLPHKRELMIDRLLADPRQAEHFAMTWRALLLPEADTDAQIRFFQAGFEAWLRKRREETAGFDLLVRELLAVPIAAPDQPPQMVLRDLKAPNPLAFIAAKDGDPGTIAASATRLFLGLRLECAQCHNHPFETWTQTQFWNQAAFFAGIARKGTTPFSPLSEAGDRRTITPMDSQQTVSALFLDGSQPDFASQSSRSALAVWMTSADNPWFSRAVANRVWAQFMGEGLVDPIDDFGANNPPSHPELLDALATSFAESGFNLTFLQAAICRTQAYQRTSRVTNEAQNQPQKFARMVIKPMCGEQFFATLAQAIQYQTRPGQVRAGRDEDPVRRRVLNQFASGGLYANPETSVSQALILMNGDLVNNAAGTVPARLLEKSLSTPELIEELYLLALSRYPTEAETRELAAHVDQGDPARRGERLGDVLWALLNTAEFRWNH